MSEQIAALKQEIAVLRQSQGFPGLPEIALQALRTQIAEKEAALAAMSGGPRVGTAAAQRDVNIATSQTIVNLALAVYGADPGQERREQLVRYLDRLAATVAQLPLRGLDERLDHGDGIALHHVYVMLATESRVIVAGGDVNIALSYYQDAKLENGLKAEFDQGLVLPDRAVLQVHMERETGWRVERAKLATEALAEAPRLVLCGAPGSGKSTFVRYLAWALAERAMGRDASDLAGWPADRQVLPLLLPLRTLAGALVRDGVREQVIFAALTETIAKTGVRDADELLSQALHSGSALLLLDGLDEVPLDAVAGTTVDRAAVLSALRAFARTHRRATILLTTRPRAFDEQRRAELGWPVEILAPLTLGQMRFFVKAWYAELAGCSQITPELATRLEGDLRTAIEGKTHLTELGRTPLLLTLMAIVLYNKGELPRDRPQLYERVLELLLGQWDKVREGQSLAEVLGLTGWTADRFRPLLDRLSYQAHRDVQSADGRGRLVRSAVRDALIGFFEQASFREEQAMALAGRCLDYFNQRSGLLVPDDERDSYAFVHLTLQEHCAGRFIATSRNPMELILEHRGDDRWREPIMLGLGAVQSNNGFLIESVIRRLGDGVPEGDPERRQLDLILAAEIGADRDWAVLREQGLDVDGLQALLRRGLVSVLEERGAPLPVQERLRAGRLLSPLGDPRYPVTLDQWHHTLQHERPEQFTGEGSHYWRYVPAGRYRIGGWEADEKSADLDLEPFWIARLPITVAQFAQFVVEGYSAKAERWWTSLGWMWKRGKSAPGRWGSVGYHEPNQPVTYLTWYEVKAFCEWLTERLGDRLADGYVVRLPTEAEWEAAAAGDGQGGRQPYPWGEGEVTLERAIYKVHKLNATAPVGCCSTGAAACGALDMVGNVWEWTYSSAQAYPQAAHQHREDLTWDDDVPLRGAAHYTDSTYVRCGARFRNSPDGWDYVNGLRVIVAPRLAHSS